MNFIFSFFIFILAFSFSPHKTTVYTFASIYRQIIDTSFHKGNFPDFQKGLGKYQAYAKHISSHKKYLCKPYRYHIICILQPANV